VRWVGGETAGLVSPPERQPGLGHLERGHPESLKFFRWYSQIVNEDQRGTVLLKTKEGGAAGVTCGGKRRTAAP
jgi:hypothetical protein